MDSDAGSDVLAPLMVLPGVKDALEEANQIITSVLLPAKRHGARIGEKALTAAAVATTELDNHSDIGVAATLIAEIPQLPDLRTSPLQALAHLHAVAAVSESAESKGRPRADFAGNDRLLSLINVTSSAQPALLVAAIVHGELIALAPFSTANGLVARAMMRTVLVQRGIEPLICPEIGLRDLGVTALSHALKGYTSGDGTGVAEWIIFNCKAMQFSVSALNELIVAN